MTGGDPAAGRHVAEQTARASFGRLVAWLAWQWRDLAAAEDALADALVRALEVWPRDGVPASPEAWLLAAARLRLLHAARHDRVRHDPAVTALLACDRAATPAPEIPDVRLRLMFTCAHPAIEPEVRMPLMLQTVLGLTVAQIAPAMLTSPAALAQRLVRAKLRIREAGVPFDEPERADLPGRLHHVLEAIYAAFGVGADAVDGAEARVHELRTEALFLGTVVADLAPDSAEPKGLVALMHLCEARRAAQIGPCGAFVPLAQQDVRRWDRERILQADRLLREAAQRNSIGPFQLEAAIQSAHCQRLFTGTTPWPAIVELYDALERSHPTVGAHVAAAVARAEAGDPRDGLARLMALNPKSVANLQPWWVAKAHLLALLGRRAEADAALTTAIGLSASESIRAHLADRRRALAQAVPPIPPG